MVDIGTTEIKSTFPGGSILVREEDNTQTNEQDNYYVAHKIEQFDREEPARLTEPGTSSPGR